MKRKDNDNKISLEEKIADLIIEDVSQVQLPVKLPDRYRMPFIHTENGFVNNYCLSEEEEKKKRIRKK